MVYGIHEMGTYDQGYENHLRFVPPSSKGHAYRYLDIYYCDGIVNCTIEWLQSYSKSHHYKQSYSESYHYKHLLFLDVVV